ncbi:acyl-CoA 6-desaturase-like [Pecten maximus]|uniref:acyl-CoA 6-desaturase-like n=1 Tax=Pecten maximus TaxID=6579 RepID=UPI001458A9F1|nr:acyl-CoA 6-desaturase-like [Pecten maximus]XP_033728462.1 acyl-CoA 6-desaturase-like [Pecten maximus]XP_033728463.1 acyl-CoA 6-desaturase-like [Pecten maximus]
MGRGGKQGGDTLTWREVQGHNKPDDKWLVIDGQVYNITKWAGRHPGGSRVISHYAGQDATEAFKAFHNDLATVKKFLSPIHVGNVEDYRQSCLDDDFRTLCETVKKKGYYEPSYIFFLVMMVQVFVLESLSYLVMAYFGTGWVPYLISLVCAAAVQAQAGWIQHDFGHLSVFKNSTLDHLIQYYLMGIVKGASPHWWNHLHFQHHAKPNVINKDPDVAMDKLFVIGEVMPVQVAKTRRKFMPFNLQHRYFFLIGPPLLFPVYFQFMLFRHIYTRRLPVDLALVMIYFFKYFYLFTPMLGLGGAIVFYFMMRCLESHWFTWVTQSNHIPMNIDNDQALHWMKLQMQATCDIQKSVFNDWFTGHLNFQIEHHLFPTMPRHNLYKVAPLVQSLCKKHDIKYEVKPLWTAFKDIVRCLKHSGALWEGTYNAYHS